MRSLLKFPLLAFLCVLSAETLLSAPAVAGMRGVTLPDSGGAGLENTFAPSGEPMTPSSQVLSARIVNGLLNSWRGIQQSGSVRSVGGQNLPISRDQAAGVESALLRRGPEVESRLSEMQEQLASETGLRVDVDRLGNSPEDLQTAINSIDALINGLNREQLVAIASSPTFNALLQMLEDAKAALAENDSDNRLADPTSESGLVKVTLSPARAPAAGTPPVQRPIQVQPQPPTPPRPAPAVQTPVRGLW